MLWGLNSADALGYPVAIDNRTRAADYLTNILIAPADAVHDPAPRREPNVTLRGKLAAFRVLALRREDPDALFFDRRLAIEGETETGLLVKNFLDAFEFDVEAHVTDVLPAPLARPVVAALAGAAHARRVYSRMAPAAQSMPAEPPRYPSQ